MKAHIFPTPWHLGFMYLQTMESQSVRFASPLPFFSCVVPGLADLWFYDVCSPGHSSVTVPSVCEHSTEWPGKQGRQGPAGTFNTLGSSHQQGASDQIWTVVMASLAHKLLEKEIWQWPQTPSEVSCWTTSFPYAIPIPGRSQNAQADPLCSLDNPTRYLWQFL